MTEPNELAGLARVSPADEKHPRESAKVFAAFMLYLDLGQNRSLAGTG